MFNKIGIENFRIFKETTNFNIKPITILTGPNNAGKSSLIKFLLLIKEGLYKLNFEVGDHNLESFEKVLNWQSKDDKLRFNFTTDKREYNIVFTYDKGLLITINVYKEQSLIFEFYEHSGDFLKNSKDITFQQLKNFNINYYIDKLYNRETENTYSNTNEFQNDLATLNKDYLLFELFIYEVNVTDKYKEKLIEIQNNIYAKWITNYEDTDVKTPLFETLEYVLKDLKDNQKSKVLNILREELGIDDLVVKYSPLGSILFETVYPCGIDRFSGEEMSFNFFRDIIKSIPSLINFKRTGIHYLQANRGNQRRVLVNKSDNAIDEITLEFSKSKNIHKEFIEKAFEIVGIKGQLEVKRYENVISVVYLKTKNGNLALADMGFGYSQLIPIILKIHNIYSNIDKFYWSLLEKNENPLNQVLILEEPEANLHPNLQSKLADILILAHKTFGLSFVVETHSEYLIRKLQYLTAKKEINNDKIVIYYFNADEYVTKTEKKVKEIQINETGGLTDSFGPGFYDESTNLQFELIKINHAQSN